jgi:uncharacterized protein
MENHIAIITGASIGIGYELAKLFAQEKKNLLLVARNQDKLKEVALELESKYSIKAYTLAVDLSLPDSPKQIYGFTKGNGLFVETLVNNAGFGSNGEFAELGLSEELSMIQVNITSLVHLTRLFIPDMIQNKKGQILNVASTAAFQPGPYMANYYATKAYVLHFTEALAEELEKYGIKVSALCPGPTVTGFQERANMNNALLFKGPLTMSAESVAKSGYAALKRGQIIHIAGFLNWLLTKSVLITPRFIIRKIIAGINRKSS